MMFVPIVLAIQSARNEEFNETHSKIVHGERKIYIEARY